MFNALHLSTVTKFFDPLRASLNPVPSDAQAEESQPLDPNEESIPLESQGEMGRSLGGQYEKPEGREGDAVAQIVAIVSVAVFLGITWIMTLTSGSSFVWFAWHPLLLSLAIALFTYGILTLQPTSQARTKAAGLARHQLAMIILGIPLALLGFLAIFFTKIAHGRAHFTTWHAISGITTIVALVAQVVLGGGSVWFNGRLFGGNPKAKSIWKYHRVVGYVTFFMLLLTLHLGGAWSSWSQEHSSYFPRVLAYTFAPAGLIAAVYSRMRLSKMKFF